MSNFNALMVTRDEHKKIHHAISSLTVDDLPADGDVLVKVRYSTVNYKDGLCLSGKGDWYAHIRTCRELTLRVKWLAVPIRVTSPVIWWC